MWPIQIFTVATILGAFLVQVTTASDFIRPTDVLSASEAHFFADIVYDTDYGKGKLEKLRPEWKFHKGRDNESGLAYAVYVRSSDGQRVLAYRGTSMSNIAQGWKDWSTNVISSSSLFDFIPPALRGMHWQYDEALQVALNTIHENKFSRKGRPLIVVGDSKGGGHVEYTCAMLQCFGFAFNSAPLGDMLRARIPESRQEWANKGGILRIKLKSDAVSKTDIIPGSKHLGSEIKLDMPQVYQEAYYRTLGKAGVVGKALNIEFTWDSHVQRDLMSRAIRDYESKSTSKPRLNIPITPSWWVSQNAATDRSGALATANAIARTGRNVRSVLLVGQGKETEELAVGLRAAFPNVTIQRTSLIDGRGVQAVARNKGVDLIVGIKSDHFKGRLPIEHIVMRMEDARSILSTFNMAAENVERWGLLESLSTGTKHLSKMTESVSKATGWAEDVLSLAGAMNDDINRWKNHDRVILRSSTVEALYVLGVKAAIKNPMDIFARDHLTRLVAKHTTLRSIAGNPRHLYDKIARAPSFGVDSLLVAAGRTIRDGRMNIETIENLADGLVGLTAGVAGFAWGLSNSGNIDFALRVAGTSQDAAVFTAQMSRARTQGAFNRLQMHWSGHVDKLVDAYKTVQAVNVHHNIKTQTFSQYYARELEALNLSPKDIARYDRLAVEFETQRLEQHGHAVPKTLTTAVADVNQPIQNYTLSSQQAGDLRTASRLVKNAQRVVVFGHGRSAQKTSRRLSRELGSGRVVHIHSNPSRGTQWQIARNHGATAIVNVRQTHYREITNSGVRQIVDLPMRKLRSSYRDETSRGRLTGDSSVGSPSPLQPPPPPPGISGLGSGPIRNSSTFRPHPVRPSMHRFHRIDPSPGVGGVMLRGMAHIKGDQPLNASSFSLIFEDASGQVDIHKLRMFTTALWSVYFSKEGPGISIDPIAKGLDKHLVRYIGEVVNTDLGRVMRETDYLMKKWAVGEGKPECIEGFRAPDEIAADRGVVHVGASSRFWFLPQDMTFRQAEGALFFDDGWIKLDTEYLSATKGQQKSPENEAFARFFTEHYWEIAACYPVFEELFEYAKYVSLAKYLKKHQAPMLWFLLANRDMVITEDSPGVVQAFAKQSDHIEYVHIEGGVDLGAAPSANRYVLDHETIEALQQARAQQAKYKTDMGSETLVQAEAVESAGAQYAIAPPTQVTISGSTAHGDIFHTDVALQLDGQAGLELTRYYNPALRTFSSFGDGWHLVIPYRVEPVDDDQITFANAQVPKRMRVLNLLTGTSEALDFDARRYGIGGYLPSEPDQTITIGLFLMADGSFRLADKLGNQFHFDQGGHLVDMLLAGGYRVQYDYHRVTIDHEGLERLPCILVPAGKETRQVLNVRLPVKLELQWQSGAEPETFVLADDAQIVGYKPQHPATSRYRFLAMLSDGSLVLADKNDDEVAFDGAGRFVRAQGNVIGSVRRDRFQVALQYAFKAGGFRIQQARVTDAKLDKTARRLTYTYDGSGRLLAVDDSLGMTTSLQYVRDFVSHTSQ